eukprot:6197363-Pleurochrysis_carterae.AAC.1
MPTVCAPCPGNMKTVFGVYPSNSSSEAILGTVARATKLRLKPARDLAKGACACDVARRIACLCGAACVCVNACESESSGAATRKDMLVRAMVAQFLRVECRTQGRAVVRVREPM